MRSGPSYLIPPLNHLIKGKGNFEICDNKIGDWVHCTKKKIKSTLTYLLTLTLHIHWSAEVF